MALQKKSPAQLLEELKAMDLSHTRVHLVIVREYKQGRTSKYILKYINTDKILNRRLRDIVMRQISEAQEVDAYSFDAPEPEGGLVRSIDYEETDFHKIYEQYYQLNPEEDVITDVEDLAKAKGYMIILSGKDKEIIGYRRRPESWATVEKKGIFNVLFEGNVLLDLADQNVFGIANNVEMFYFGETLFIASLKGFERAMNFREGMMDRAEVLYDEFEQMNLFVDLNILKGRVGDNQRYLRKLAIIENKGHYKDPAYLESMRQLCLAKNWNVQFVDGQIVFTEGNLDLVLRLLQNQRLHSELTNEDFDVDSAKAVQ